MLVSNQNIYKESDINNVIEKVGRKTLIKGYEEGSLGMIDMTHMQHSIATKWITKLQQTGMAFLFIVSANFVMMSIFVMVSVFCSPIISVFILLVISFQPPFVWLSIIFTTSLSGFVWILFPMFSLFFVVMVDMSSSPVSIYSVSVGVDWGTINIRCMIFSCTWLSVFCFCFFLNFSFHLHML